MKSEIKILKLLLDKKEDRFTIKKISEALGINYRIAYENVGLLEKEGLLKVTKLGNSKICEFTNKFSNKTYEAEYLRRAELFKSKDFLVIYNRLAELNFSFIALLFGSYAKGTANKHSDIDILSVGGDEKEIKAAISLLPDRIHLTWVSFEEFIHMAKSREFTAVSEAIKHNIILIGIEEYYRVMENANR
ncbi:MAG: nucleotidyltransferase domain-containing protein [Nanoarchaeota archaeon]|nr:nucleotidyltransferase domain-containing protein [Nanoarchaeota archaeon]MBU1005130.1 nucleotidyltransferase domain-containing protein [Nanoarchaeota archaeon]MBU1946968.1 nucleotidyltransferase domain-containing protein [Nanoarchaeota archaeon]